MEKQTTEQEKYLMTSEQRFYQFCAGEFGIVLKRLVIITARADILIPVSLVSFLDLIFPVRDYREVLLTTIFKKGTRVFPLLLLFSRHTFVFFLFLASFTRLSLFTTTLAECRIKLPYGCAS